jgi:hypothetical protein
MVAVIVGMSLIVASSGGKLVNDLGFVERVSNELSEPVVLVLDTKRVTTVPDPDSDNKESYRKFLRRRFDITSVDGASVVGLDWCPEATLLNRRSPYLEASEALVTPKENQVYTLESLAKKLKISCDYPKYFDGYYVALSKSAIDNPKTLTTIASALGLAAKKTPGGYTFTVDPKTFRKNLVLMATKRRIDPREMDEPEDYDYARAVYASLNDDQITQMVLNPSTVFTADVLITSPLMTAGRQKFDAFARDNPRADAASHAAIVKAYLNGIDFDNPRGMVEWWLAELPQFRMRGKDLTHWYSF